MNNKMDQRGGGFDYWRKKWAWRGVCWEGRELN